MNSGTSAITTTAARMPPTNSQSPVVGGTPACYVRGLDHAPYDVQSFVRDGLIFELDRVDRFAAADVRLFYARPATAREKDHALKYLAETAKDLGGKQADARSAAAIAKQCTNPPPCRRRV